MNNFGYMPLITILILLAAMFFCAFMAGRSCERYDTEQERIECVKDSLYNEYVTDKLNNQ